MNENDVVYNLRAHKPFGGTEGLMGLWLIAQALLVGLKLIADAIKESKQ